MFYKDGSDWKPVESTTPFASEKDRYNRVSFKPVLTDSLKLEVVLQSEWSAGIQELKVK